MNATIAVLKTIADANGDKMCIRDRKQTEQRYREQVEQTITKLLVSNPAPDKNNDPLGWTAHMNSLQAQAAELAMPIVTSL